MSLADETLPCIAFCHCCAAVAATLVTILSRPPSFTLIFLLPSFFTMVARFKLPFRVAALPRFEAAVQGRAPRTNDVTVFRVAIVSHGGLRQRNQSEMRRRSA